MNEIGYVDKHETDWKRLSHLCDRSEATLKSLSSEEFDEFVRLYRRASTDLAVIRTRSTNLQLAEYLNDLVGRAYGILYRAPRGSILAALGDSVKLSAETVRKRWRYIAVSGALFFGSSVFAYFLMGSMPQTRDRLVPPGWEGVVESWRKPFEARSAGESAGATGFYLSNNPLASVQTASIAAVTFGVGTAYSLFSNGALLGALARDLVPHGQTGRFLIWVSPHGVPELSGIIVAGGAGFLMGWALISPGRRKRGDALREAGKDGMVLLTTAVVLMFIAAPIEGYFSFNPNVPNWAKLSFALVSAGAWAAFWSGYGRKPNSSAG